MTTDQMRIVSAALDELDNLNLWEYDFVNKLADYSEACVLSEPQDEELQNIALKLDLV